MQAAVPGELKSPPTWNLEVGGDFNFTGIAACKVEVPPHFKHKSGGVHAGLT